MRIPQQLCILCLVLSSPAVTQQTVTKDATAMAIVQQSLAAMGGGQNFVDVQAIGTTTAYGDSGALSYPITLQATGAASIRSDVSKPSGTRTYVTDGSRMCVDNVFVDLPPDAQTDLAWKRIDFVPALSILSAYADPNVQVLYQGAGTVNGAITDAVSIGFVSPGISDPSQVAQRWFWIDRATSLLVKVGLTNTTSSASIQGPVAEMFLSGYQVSSGFAVPMSQATYVDGVLSEDLEFTSFAFNSGSDPSQFAMTCEAPNAQ